MKVEVDIEGFRLDAKRLQLLGIILNELLTNSMKYAFHDGEKGKIEVEASCDKGRVVVSVGDDGPGIPEAVSFNDSPGFGLQLGCALSEQMKARLRLDRNPKTRVVLEFSE
ncbi:MAG: sensor histidine kinase [Spirochaetes bacterium]|nr:sensor histidine kinase [Spirochaetota bacterium]